MKKQEKKVALITGMPGMDASHLADYLINLGYKVFGLIRRSSNRNYQNIAHLLQNEDFVLIQGDLADQNSIFRAIAKSNPDQIYNLGAQSFVAQSFKTPENTANITGLGCLRVLEAIRQFDKQKKIKFYQAGSSQMFGKMVQNPANEYTPFYPRSPYGVSKVFAHYMTKNYRETYDMYACNGILFNHESERRGHEFVTRKITAGIKDILDGKKQYIELGNLDARRDWGYAPKYCFPAGTKILVNNELGYHKLKSINIQQVKVGDSVLSWDGEKKCLDKVTKTFVNKSNELLEIKFSNGNKIICTKQHPFGVNVNGTIQWIEAKDLRTEMECVQYNHYSTNMRIKNLLNIGKNNEQRLGKDKSVQVSNTQVVNIVSIQNITLQDEIDVYNFQTENYHNYFAYGILVHNCEAMHLMLQQPSADDYVVATGESHSIKEFLQIAFNYAGLDNWQKYVRINPIYYRPCEVDTLCGTASKIKSVGWQYNITFKQLVENMMKKELEK